MYSLLIMFEFTFKKGPFKEPECGGKQKYWISEQCRWARNAREIRRNTTKSSFGSAYIFNGNIRSFKSFSGVWNVREQGASWRRGSTRGRARCSALCLKLFRTHRRTEGSFFSSSSFVKSRLTDANTHAHTHKGPGLQKRQTEHGSPVPRRPAATCARSSPLGGPVSPLISN